MQTKTSRLRVVGCDVAGHCASHYVAVKDSVDHELIYSSPVDPKSLATVDHPGILGQFLTCLLSTDELPSNTPIEFVSQALELAKSRAQNSGVV